MYFAAVELKQGEDPEEGIRHFVSAAADLSIPFKKIRTYGPIGFARSEFARFQTDCQSFVPIVLRLKAEGRGLIIPVTTGGYRAYLANGREGSVGTVLMHGIARPGHGRIYIGPSHPHWQAQFTPGGRPAASEDPQVVEE